MTGTGSSLLHGGLTSNQSLKLGCRAEKWGREQAGSTGGWRVGAEGSPGCCAGVREDGDAGGVHPYGVGIEAK